MLKKHGHVTSRRGRRARRTAVPGRGATLSGAMVYRTPQCRCRRSVCSAGLRTSLDSSRDSQRGRSLVGGHRSRPVAAPLAAAARSDIERGDGLSHAPMSLRAHPGPIARRRLFSSGGPARTSTMGWVMKGLATSVGMASVLLLLSHYARRRPSRSMHEAPRTGGTT